MLLLYRNYDRCHMQHIDQFTFHYASTLSQSLSSARPGRSVFTFHYASTLSFIESTLMDGYVGFTFHYASTLSEWIDLWSHDGDHIYIPLCFYFIPLMLSTKYSASANLHSTMLLLYRILKHLVVQAITIYIPLCFYFITTSLVR